MINNVCQNLTYIRNLYNIFLYIAKITSFYIWKKCTLHLEQLQILLSLFIFFILRWQSSFCQFQIFNKENILY
jgi:hypothetical protein